MPFCPECGAEMQNAQKYCHACGMEVGRVDGEVDSIPNQPSAVLPPSIHFKKGGSQYRLKWPKFFEKRDIPRLYENIGMAAGIDVEDYWGSGQKFGELEVGISAGRKKCTFIIQGTRSRWAANVILIPVLGPILFWRRQVNCFKPHIQTAERLASAIESLLPPAN